MNKSHPRVEEKRNLPTVAFPLLFTAKGDEKTLPTRDAAVSAGPLGPAGHGEDQHLPTNPEEPRSPSPTVRETSSVRRDAWSSISTSALKSKMGIWVEIGKYPIPRNCCRCCLVARSCPVLCDPMDYNPLGSSVHGSSQVRILEWVTISFSRGSS